MSGYVPGEQPDSPDVIKLNTNENPFPPGPEVQAALAEIDAAALRRYPPPTALELRQTIAAHHQVDADNVIVTNGGDELLRLAISTFVENNESIAVLEPSYTLYETLAQAQGCEFLRLQLADDWSLPSNLFEQLNDSDAKMCLLPNPHAPSGTLLDESKLTELASAFKGILLIDEAYVDFVDPARKHSCVSMIFQFNNVLLLRTFSKGYSLAGLRIAYGIGSDDLINPMQYKTKDSYNTDFIAQKLARAALLDQKYAQQSWAFVREQRKLLQVELEKLGFSCPESQANFLLFTVPEQQSAEEIYQFLKQQKILVRFFKQPGLDNKLRISIGSETENQSLISALKLFLTD